MCQRGLEDVVSILARHVRNAGDQPVGDDVHGPVLAAQDCGAQVDLLHGARDAVDGNRVPNADLILQQHQQAAQPVLDERLRAQAQRQARDAQAGEQRLDVEGQLIESHHQRHYPDDEAGKLRQHRHDGCGALLEFDLGSGSVAVHGTHGIAAQAAQQAAGKVCEQPGSAQNDQHPDAAKDPWDPLLGTRQFPR